MKNVYRFLLSGFMFSFLLTGSGCMRDKVGDPVLLLTTTHNFGFYTSELLKAEGFNVFTTDSLSDHELTSGYLDGFRLVILPAQPVSQLQKEMLEKYVRRGGHLIAFCPDRTINGIFGIIPRNMEIENAYVQINNSTDQGKGLIGTPFRIHSAGEIYANEEAEVIATYHADTLAGKNFPAVVSNNYGEGTAVAFLYNLPENIVYSRQGNPDFAGEEKDGINGLRAMDLFTGGWVDTTSSTLNPDDEQMHLLSHCIEHSLAESLPLPRLWYFPDTLNCLVTLTNDGESNGEQDFEGQFREVDSMGAKMSIYILEVDKVTKAWTDKWASRGFEISGHPDETAEASDPQWGNMDKAIKLRKHQMAEKFGQDMNTIVNHWFVWCGRDSTGRPDFTAQAEIESLNGIHLDANYAHYDNGSNQGHFLGQRGKNQGNFTGSGLIMKFAGSHGKLLDIYQLLTDVYDQEYMENKDQDGFFECFKGLMDRSLNEGIYSFISVKAHNNEYYFSREPLLHMISYANKNGIPVWTAAHLLDFMRMRDDASFKDIKWKNHNLSFTLVSRIQSPDGLTCMIPGHHDGKRIGTVTVNGVETSLTHRMIKGYEYALVTVDPGKVYQIEATYP